MPAARPLSFDRVRVIRPEDADASTAARAASRHRVPPLESDQQRLGAWRTVTVQGGQAPASTAMGFADLDRSAPAAAMPATGVADPLAAGDGPPPLDQRPDLAPKPDGTSSSASPGVGPRDAEAPVASLPGPAPDAGQAVPQPAVLTPPPAPLERPGPVAALVKAVETTTAFRRLADLVVDTCGDEALRDSGPWEFSLDLAGVGLPGHRVDLRLSRQLLELRFRCADPEGLTLLSRHQAGLAELVQAGLGAPLEIEITMSGV